MILGYIRDVAANGAKRKEDKVVIIDVGAGCGRLGYYIIKHLLASKYMWPDPAVAPFLLEWLFALTLDT